MTLHEAGFTAMKFFPASAAGGTAFVKSLASPLPQITICPTGGISAETAPDWLALPNVRCLGGSWVAPQKNSSLTSNSQPLKSWPERRRHSRLCPADMMVE